MNLDRLLIRASRKKIKVLRFEIVQNHHEVTSSRTLHCRPLKLGYSAPIFEPPTTRKPVKTRLQMICRSIDYLKGRRSVRLAIEEVAITTVCLNPALMGHPMGRESLMTCLAKLDAMLARAVAVIAQCDQGQVNCHNMSTHA